MKAYDKQDKGGLLEIQTQLVKVVGFEGQQLALLIKGMVADLEQNAELAVEAYSLITFRPFKLLSLKRLLDYAMQANQHEQVLIYLEGLIEFSFEYMLPYADYLALLGQDEFAYGVVDAFTKKMPGHFSALLKLAEFALKVGKTAEALQALQAAEQLEPNNPQVKQMIGLLLPE